jgi:hypothetical protein
MITWSHDLINGGCTEVCFIWNRFKGIFSQVLTYFFVQFLFILDYTYFTGLMSTPKKAVSATGGWGDCKGDFMIVVLLPGFQKGRDIKASQGKGQGAVLAKKGQFASYKEKLEK